MWEKMKKAQAEKSNDTCLDCSDFWMGCCTGDCEPFTPIHTPVLDRENPPKIRLADVFLDGPIIRGRMSVEMPKGGMDKMTAENMRQLAIDYLQKIVDDLNDPFSDGVDIGVQKMQTAKNEATALLNAFKNWEIVGEAILEETCAPCMENLGIPEQRAQEIKELVLMLHLYDKMKGEKPNE